MFRYFQKKNFPVVTGCCKPGYPTYNLNTGHQYSMLDIVDLKDDQGKVAHTLVKLRDPHSKDYYTGPWSDKSDLWTESFKKQVGHKTASDGIFFITMEFFMQAWPQSSVAILDYDLACNYHKEELEATKR